MAAKYNTPKFLELQIRMSCICILAVPLAILSLGTSYAPYQIRRRNQAQPALAQQPRRRRRYRDMRSWK